MKRDWSAIFPELLKTGQAALEAEITALLDHADAGGSLHATHQELATELGTAREVISRQLKDFEQRKLVRLQRGSIVLLDRAGLGVLAAS